MKTIIKNILTRAGSAPMKGLAAAVLLLCGCQKTIDVPAPVTSFNAENVYADNATAAGVLTGMYTKISQGSLGLFQSVTGISAYTGLSGDELVLGKDILNTTAQLYYLNKLDEVQAGWELWNLAYAQLYVANAAIEGLGKSTTLDPDIQRQLTGEAKFIRAFYYFYLVNLYGDVPLVLSTDYKLNALLPRMAKEKVWQQIIEDLTEAKGLLSTNYLDGAARSPVSERVRPNKYTAQALLSRAYLFTGNWAAAEKEAGEVIDLAPYYQLEVDLDKVFTSASKEAIWQLQPVEGGLNTQDGAFYILPDAGPNDEHPVYLSNGLVTSFSGMDKRLTHWIASVAVSGKVFSYPYKYKISTAGNSITEYQTVFRLAEQYLIRAEARMRLGDTDGAIGDLNIIRKRAGLPSLTSMTQTLLIPEIAGQRRLELFTEWGHRWLDLKRTGQVDQVMQAVAGDKETTWANFQSLYPVPLEDLKSDPNLIQNVGY